MFQKLLHQVGFIQNFAVVFVINPIQQGTPKRQVIALPDLNPVIR